MATRGPTNGIFQGLAPFTGVSTGPTPGNFGVSGPNVPSVSWAPTGTDNATGPAEFLRFGIPKTSHGHISLKGFDFVQYVYLAPPFGDDSQRFIAPEMLAFVVNNRAPDDMSTTVLTLAKVNQIAKECYDEYRIISDNRAGNTETSKEAIEFKGYMEKYGERSLEVFNKIRDTYDATELADMIRFSELAVQDLFCWLTRFGIMSRITYVGPVINTNAATSLQELDTTQYSDHYCEVNVCYAKRGKIANVFGRAFDVTTGSRLWMCLQRKRIVTHQGVHFGHYQVVPGGSKTQHRPSDRDRLYIDDSGRTMLGHVWTVGTVMVPGPSSPSQNQIQDASNTGARCNEREAYEQHGTLPTLVVAVAFKQ